MADKYKTGQYILLKPNEEKQEPNYQRIGLVKWHKKGGILLERGKGLDSIVVQPEMIEQKITKEEAEQMMFHDIKVYLTKASQAEERVKEVSKELNKAMNEQSSCNDTISGSKFTPAWLKQDDSIAQN